MYEDIVHEALGTEGKYQIWINLILSLLSFNVAWQMLSMNFLAAKTDFWCEQPEQNRNLWSPEKWKNFSLENNLQCDYYDIDYSDDYSLNKFNERYELHSTKPADHSCDRSP